MISRACVCARASFVEAAEERRSVGRMKKATAWIVDGEVFKATYEKTQEERVAEFEEEEGKQKEEAAWGGADEEEDEGFYCSV